MQIMAKKQLSGICSKRFCGGSIEEIAGLNKKYGINMNEKNGS
ncbi:hypothetical protein [Microbulbifer sp. A4B17]|nr:hypothetical protein [Microbulbifer sp. A4B17]